MSLINTEVKPFKAQALKAGKFIEVSEADLKGKWSVVFFYPADFTFVCPTELEDLADNYAEFQNPSTAGFVLPLGATMNMSGTALFEGCVVLFVAQAFGVELSITHQAILMLLSVLSAVAVAGIPGGSLPMIAGLLATFGIPPEGIGIVIGVDRVLDMMRTTVNVGSDIVTATVVDQQLRGRFATNS